MNIKIGVFDSGVGGENVVSAIKKRLPDAEIAFLSDPDNLPYGDKSEVELIQLIEPFIKEFERLNVSAIVIACNTLSTNVGHQIRSMTDLPVVLVVPMIKPACALSKTDKITVCATPATLNSTRYKELLAEYAQDTEIYEPDCSGWAALIESNNQDKIKLAEMVEKSAQFGSDVILLGCTHYHWIEEMLQELAGPEVSVLQPTEPVVDQLIRVLQQPG